MDFVERAFLTDYAVAATVGGVACRGVFDAAYRDTLGMANAAPQLLVRESDLPTLAVGQSAVIPAGTFTVRAIEPDGTGMATLILESV